MPRKNSRSRNDRKNPEHSNSKQARNNRGTKQNSTQEALGKRLGQSAITNSAQAAKLLQLVANEKNGIDLLATLSTHKNAKRHVQSALLFSEELTFFKRSVVPFLARLSKNDISKSLCRGKLLEILDYLCIPGFVDQVSRFLISQELDRRTELAPLTFLICEVSKRDHSFKEVCDF